MSDLIRIIAPDSPIDRLSFGDLCLAMGRRIIEAEPNHLNYRIDFYREITIDGRNYFVRTKFVIPFLAIAPEEN